MTSNRLPSTRDTLKKKELLEKDYSSAEILRGLKSRDNSIIRYIYFKYFPMISHFIKTHSGLTEDAEDVFQDALIIIYKNLNSESFRLTSSFPTYLFSICRNLFLQRLARLKIHVKYTDHIALTESAEMDQAELAKYNAELVKLISSYLNRLDHRSQLIMDSFLRGTSHKEIAQIVGLSSEDYAKCRKFQIKRNLKNKIESDPAYRRLIMEMCD